jgi:hypothetical protein
MRPALALLCLALFNPAKADCQAPEVPPLRFAAGTVVTFHVQSRLRSEGDDTLNGLTQGTAMQVKLRDAIDSTQNRDGSSFQGTLLATIGSGRAIVHAEAEVHGILVLLRSRSRPNGFRYELMVTSIREAGRSRPLSASLSSSLFEATAALPAPGSGATTSADSTP